MKGGQYHVKQAYGCRCWAEPYKGDAAEGDDAPLEEQSSQVVTYAAPDASPSWTWEDFVHHYYFGKGQPVTLDEIGHLQDIIDCARTHNQTAAGGGTIFNRVADQLLEAARQKGEGSFLDYFQNGYEFRDFVWSLGGATVTASFFVNVVEKGDFLIVTAEIEYTFTDMFTNPLDLPEGKSEYKGWDLPFSMPYPVIGTWSTHLEAAIRK